MSAGRLRAWREALQVARKNRRGLLLGGAVVGAVVLVVNVFPRTPAYERGLITGVLVVAYVWLAAWLVWVASGLSPRLNGVWAESWTFDDLKHARAVYEVVPSLQFDRYDVDHVAVTAAGLLAIETKWHGWMDDAVLRRDIDQAARAARSLRLNLDHGRLPVAQGLTDGLVRAVLVVWGPGARKLADQQVETGAGSVHVLPGPKLASWLDGDELRRGPIGPDYAQALAGELTELARTRETQDKDAHSPLLRYLARPR